MSLADITLDPIHKARLAQRFFKESVARRIRSDLSAPTRSAETLMVGQLTRSGLAAFDAGAAGVTVTMMGLSCTAPSLRGALNAWTDAVLGERVST